MEERHQPRVATAPHGAGGQGLRVSLTLGPIPSAYVVAWAEDAQMSMQISGSGALPLPFRVPREFFQLSFSLFADWVAAARASETFTFAIEDADADLTVAQIQYWHNLGRKRRELIDAHVAPPMSPEAWAFADHVRNVTLDALVACGRLDAGTARRFLEAWPDVTSPPGAPLSSPTD